jgi:UDP-galactopyranose mutase
LRLKADYIVVGTGLTGATLARMLADAGREVVVLERRNDLGGNAHDHVHPSGVRVHTYGPHYFRTSSEHIWTFVNRFSTFYRYEAALKSLVDGQFENWPVAASYVRRVAGDDWQPAFNGKPSNFEEACLATMPAVIYEKFIKGYTEKQWGVPASCLAPELASRFEVHADDEPRLKRHKYQGIPVNGYPALTASMLSGIPVFTNCDYLKEREAYAAKKSLIFTGPIDEFFGFDLGRLKYRGQHREHTYISDVEFALPCGQVNNPGVLEGAHIRTLEWKHMMQPELSGLIKGTVLTRETTVTPLEPDKYEYPFPDRVNSELYSRYRQRAETLANVLICGRLGEYRYYDMDQAIGRAFHLFRTLGICEAAKSRKRG